MQHIVPTAVVSCAILIAGVLLWVRTFENAGLALEKSKHEKRQRERETRLDDLQRRMEEAERQARHNYKSPYMIFGEDFYFSGFPDDDHESIREVLRRRGKS